MDDYSQLIKQGDQAFQKEKTMDAIRAYNAAITMKDNEDEETAELLYKLSQAYSILNPKEPDVPRKYAQRALDIHKKIGLADLVVMDALNLAFIELQAGNRAASLTELDKAIAMASEIKDESLISTCLISKADTLAGLASKRAEARGLYMEASALAEKNGFWDNFFEAQHGVLEIIRQEGDVEKAFSLAMKLLDHIDLLCTSIKNKKERADFRKSVSYVYDSASDIAMELENVEEAIKIAQRLKEA
ncbi:MAG: hypothetical protein ACYDAZ_00885 [Thermoplasmataceae archaeon]